ncbi:hypothetical protein EBR96_02370 [bacterium]|nr:hypothetical protein [bacterium]
MRFGTILGAVGIAVVLGISGCGKVTQVSSKQAESPTYDLKFSVELMPTASTTYKLASSNYFTVNDTILFSAVSGISKDGKLAELSWGKGALQFKPSPVSPDVVTAKVVSYRKGDVEIENSDYKWARLSYDHPKLTWTADMKKIRLGYPVYLLSFYTEKGKAYLTVVDSKRVSGNPTITLSEVGPYSTFLSTLFLIDLADRKGNLDATATISDLRGLFTEPFFNLLQYKLPVTAVTKFNPENPTFIYNRELEKRLLSIYTLWKDGETQELNTLVAKLDKDYPNWIPAKAQAMLLDRLKGQAKGDSGGSPGQP